MVPQFIDVEDKIFGPITTRQFLILLGTGLVIFLVYRLTDFSLFLTISIPLFGISTAFTWVKVKGQLFHVFLLNVIQTLRRPSLRIWNKQYTSDELKYLRDFVVNAPEVAEGPAVHTRNHMHELALLVNTGGYYKPEIYDDADE